MPTYRFADTVKPPIIADDQLHTFIEAHGNWTPTSLARRVLVEDCLTSPQPCRDVAHFSGADHASSLRVSAKRSPPTGIVGQVTSPQRGRELFEAFAPAEPGMDSPVHRCDSR